MAIGKILRILRGNMTQEELSRRSGVDKAIISKIENGKMVGTIDCHKKLSKVFGLKLSELYEYLEENKVISVEVLPGDIQHDNYKGYLEILTHIPLSKKMLPTFINLNPGQEEILQETKKAVERFIFIVQGKIEIEIEGTVYTLQKISEAPKGDSLYSKSIKKHLLKNKETSVAKILCVSTPPVL